MTARGAKSIEWIKGEFIALFFSGVERYCIRSNQPRAAGSKLHCFFCVRTALNVTAIADELRFWKYLSLVDGFGN
jgi:hypothetical protein